MRVLFNNLNSEEKIKFGNWLVERKTYTVLCVFFDSRKVLSYRIIAENGIAALFEHYWFTVVSSKIPPNWEIDVDDKFFELSPKAWMEAGFWERFFDDDKEAIKVFEKEAKIIFDCEE